MSRSGAARSSAAFCTWLLALGSGCEPELTTGGGQAVEAGAPNLASDPGSERPTTAVDAGASTPQVDGRDAGATRRPTDAAAADAATSESSEPAQPSGHAAHGDTTHAPDAALDAASTDAIRDADVVAMDAAPVEAELPCDSTWNAIQRSIFAAKGCTSAACHGRARRAGELDLTPAAAYAQLVHRPARAPLTVPLDRVEPGEQSLSFLYRKLEAGRGVALPAGGGSPMPVGGDPVSAAQLEALRLWIRAGAPEQGVVAGTQTLLDCTLSEQANPNKSPAPPPPAEGEGFQHASGPWSVSAGSEAEVCFATYYDLTDRVPDWAKVPCQIGGRAQTCVAYQRRELSQDAQSHHSAIAVYAGDVPANDPSWGSWRCAGGALAGSLCDPTGRGVSASAGGAECGSGVCQAEPRKMVGCTGYGPNNKEASSVGAGGAQSPLSIDRYPAGVYAELPLKGVVLWNSHGFNLTTRDTTIEQFNSFWYAPPAQRVYPIVPVLTAGESAPNWNVYIDVPPYEEREYCAPFTFPRHARLVDLSQHTHKRGVRFRAWLPPNDPACPPGGCTANERPADHQSSQYNDPVVTRFDPPLRLDGESPESRTVTFCALYDNGKSDRGLLKRKSQLPAGATCSGPLACVGGARQGSACSDDASCGEGSRCDACRVNWGVTTEDEMFFLIANYYVAP